MTALRFGFGRADISVFEPGMAMMGWGMRYNRAEGVAVPLHARAVVLDDAGGDRFAFVSVETLLITQGLWWGVLDALDARHPELGLGPGNVSLVATHTHSAPSGFGHHFWTNLNAPGFSQPVYDALVDRIVAAIRDAAAELRPGRVRVGQRVVPTGEGIAFNRSWFAYNKNRDVNPVTFARRDEATDRLMTVLRFEDAEGRAVGMLSWFALHGTCVHADNTRLHPDHKGLSALALEDEGLSVVLAQECCGDVSPNYRMDKRRGHTIGRYDDDLESAAYVGEVQARWARRALDGADRLLEGPLEVATRFVDFSGALVEPTWSPDGRPRRTRPARLGLAMVEGTAEGPGPLRRQRWLTRGAHRLKGLAGRMRARFDDGYAPDPKLPFIDLARGIEGRLAGLLPMSWVPPLDPTFKWVRDAVRAGGASSGAWVPQTVPLTLMRLGSFALAVVPFEMTTVAGRRLRATLQASLPGVEHIVVSPYANAYIGYLTTFEEYQVQHYEAGYTLFGPFTLGAVRTAFAGLAGDLGAAAVRGTLPERPPTEPLRQIPFREPWSDPLRSG